jgi:hypothetical protein
LRRRRAENDPPAGSSPTWPCCLEFTHNAVPLTRFQICAARPCACTCTCTRPHWRGKKVFHQRRVNLGSGSGNMREEIPVQLQTISRTLNHEPQTAALPLRHSRGPYCVPERVHWPGYWNLLNSRRVPRPSDVSSNLCRWCTCQTAAVVFGGGFRGAQTSHIFDSKMYIKTEKFDAYSIRLSSLTLLPSGILRSPAPLASFHCAVVFHTLL